jgi:cytochrome P450
MSRENTPSQSSHSHPISDSSPPGLVWDAMASAWRIQRHANARSALTDPHIDVVRDARPAVPISDDHFPSAVEFLESWFSRSQRECHYAVKRHLYKPYTQPSVAALAGMLESIANNCAEGLPTECDLVSDFLMPFWFRSTARMFALQEDQHTLLANVVQALSKVLELNRLDERAARVIAACIRYLRSLVEHLFAMEAPSPFVGALRELAHDEQVGGLWSAVSALSQLLTAGMNPTITGVALAWRALHEQSHLMTNVLTGGIELADFADEVLRLHPPFPFVHRWVRATCECQGVRLEPGAHLVVDLRAVNRDAEVFDHPDEFVAARDPGLSMSFGYGPHRCLGIALARLQIATTLRTLLALRPPVRPVTAGQKEGVVSSGHLLVIKTLPCRREADPSVTATVPESSASQLNREGDS